MNISQQVVILSAERFNESEAFNWFRTNRLENMLQDLNLSYSKAQGHWDGGHEESFVVIVNNKAEIDTLKDFAFKSFDQEAILHQDSNQMAHIISKDNSIKMIGRLEQVNPKSIETLDDYTIMNGQVYTVVTKGII